MVQINFARKEINCKLVYYGPGVSGKTTNLEMVHERTPDANRGELTSISTDGDRTLFFDFMPLDLGEIAGMKTKFHLYTVPGQVYYNSTRKLVLLGADGVIFVADSSRAKLAENHESLENLRENLAEMGKDLATFPLVLQWNKRDLDDAMPVDELERELNGLGAPSFEAVANRGEGVFQTLKALSARVLESINSTQPAAQPARVKKVKKEEPAPEPSPPPSPAVKVEKGSEKEEEENVLVGSAAVPPVLGGFQIERGQAGVDAAPAAPAAPAAQAREDEPAVRPKVASNPLEEVGVLATKPTTAAATMEKPATWSDEEKVRSPAVSRPSPKAAHGRQPAEKIHKLEDGADTLRREVRVIGGRPGSHSAPVRDSRALVMAAACGASIVAAAAILYFLFLA